MTETAAGFLLSPVYLSLSLTLFLCVHAGVLLFGVKKQQQKKNQDKVRECKSRAPAIRQLVCMKTQNKECVSIVRKRTVCVCVCERECVCGLGIVKRRA